MKCPRCNRQFNVPEGEYYDHDCPCGWIVQRECGECGGDPPLVEVETDEKLITVCTGCQDVYYREEGEDVR